MTDLGLLSAAIPVDPPSKATITPEIKSDWNNFLDYLNEKGLRGSKDLDKRDTNLGRSLLEEYKKAKPGTGLSYDMVKDIQSSIAEDWDMAKKIQSLKGVSSTLDDRALSEPDGWLGSLTSNGYFPTASTTDEKGKVIKDWGFDLQGYYKSLLDEQAKKVPVLSKLK